MSIIDARHLSWCLMIACLQCQSCATILNFHTTKVNVFTKGPSIMVYQSDSLKTNSSNILRLRVPRDRGPVQMIALNDSIRRDIELDPQNSTAYLLNVLYNGGLGFLVEKNNPKRYTYPRKVFLDSSLAFSTYARFLSVPRKGDIDLHLSIPYINNFLLRPENEGARKLNTGFWGLSAGVDVHYSDQQFVNFSISGVTDFFLPVPAAVDLSGAYELMTSAYLSLSNNHRMGRFTLGYGMALGRNVWELSYFDKSNPSPPPREPVTKRHLSAGLIVPVYYQIGDRFKLGILYRPTFIRLDIQPRYDYEHLISFDMAWKVPIVQKK